MQKVVGSSPIIRLYTLQNGIFRCLLGQQMTFCTRHGDEFSPSNPSLPSLALGKRMRVEAAGYK
jgi:hypothetical protein